MVDKDLFEGRGRVWVNPIYVFFFSFAIVPMGSGIVSKSSFFFDQTRFAHFLHLCSDRFC